MQEPRPVPSPRWRRSCPENRRCGDSHSGQSPGKQKHKAKGLHHPKKKKKKLQLFRAIAQAEQAVHTYLLVVRCNKYPCLPHSTAKRSPNPLQKPRNKRHPWLGSIRQCLVTHSTVNYPYNHQVKCPYIV